MATLIDLVLLATAVGSGRMWQYYRDLPWMRVGRHLGAAHDAMGDIAAQRRGAEEQLTRTTYQRRRG
ncbi:hypothetical protein [Streptacidiphilus sp. EB103A]|uniref:hypothetical protein n=1 Tax=Streptacidiphilus sp. EB103A TaxID=3156275 RepID=UPI0035129B29